MSKIFKYVMLDILKNRIVLAYTSVLLLVSFSVFSLEDTTAKGILSMLHIILMIVPLVSVVFSTIYLYNSFEFIELLLSQPVRRRTVWLSLYAGLASSLGIAFVIGSGLPILLFEPSLSGILLGLTGTLLSLVFCSLAMLAVVFTRDKARGMGIAIVLWLYFAVIFDGLLLFAVFQFADYPMERYMIALSMLNPIDLSRILILMQLDVSALMGYTGAIFKDFFGTGLGIALSLSALILWAVLPVSWSLRKFKRKDL